MCNKIVNCIVLNTEPKEVFLGGKPYYKCRCSIVGMEITAYIFVGNNIVFQDGMIIALKDYYLTNDRNTGTEVKGKYPVTMAALRVEDCEAVNVGLIGTNIEVRAEGIITKSKKVKMKTVGSDSTPFVPVTFRNLNEDGEEYGLLACCFGEIAKAVNMISKPEKVLVRARLKKNRIDDSIELSVTGLEFINKTEYEEK